MGLGLVRGVLWRISLLARILVVLGVVLVLMYVFSSMATTGVLTLLLIAGSDGVWDIYLLPFHPFGLGDVNPPVMVLQWLKSTPYWGDWVVVGFVYALLVTIATGLVYSAYRYGQREVLASTSARQVSPAERPDLHARVSRLAQQAGLPKPDVAVVPDDGPRSFAVGRAGNGTVAVTEGLLDELDGEPLDAVLAHELSHLKNRDAVILSIAAAIPIVLDTSGGDDSGSDDGTRDDDTRDDDGDDDDPNATGEEDDATDAGEDTGSSDDDGEPAWWVVADEDQKAMPLGSLLVARLPWTPPRGVSIGIGVVSILVELYLGIGIVGLFLIYLLVVGINLVVWYPVWKPIEVVTAGAAARLSRYREYTADRGAAATTGNPAALASALSTMDGECDPPTEDYRNADALQSLAILPYSHEYRVGTVLGSVSFETHPPTEKRLERLEGMVREQSK